jgi:iron-sulfur cluster assembly accessory protein
MSNQERTDVVDKTRERAGFEVVVDRQSMPYLAGATIDFVEGLKAGFVIENPTAQGTCACGDSFH